jgi:hypothetical protein
VMMLSVVSCTSIPLDLSIELEGDECLVGPGVQHAAEREGGRQGKCVYINMSIHMTE